MFDEELRTSHLAKVEAAVHYLEAVQDAAVRAYSTAGRLFVLRLVVTVILLAVAADIAKTGSTVDLGLLGLELDSVEVLVAGSVLASVLQLFDVPYYERGHQLSIRAALLYDELGYAVPRTEWASRENPVRLPYAAAVTNDALLTKLMTYDAASLGGQIVAMLFLVGTQIAVFFALRGEGYDGVWAWAFLLLPLVTLVFSVIRYWAIFQAHRRDAARLSDERSTRVLA